MLVTQVKLKNWRNFRSVDINLEDRVFIVGPNASGKSNFLDVFRFLRDIAKQGGGLQQAVRDRGGISKIRCLSARKNPAVEIEIQMTENGGRSSSWKYAIGIRQEVRGRRAAKLIYERVWRNGHPVLERPNEKDNHDEVRLTQTYLEQINANEKFRDIGRFLETVLYLHVVPQLVRHPDAFSGPGSSWRIDI